jgi:hypothetical protein
MPDALPPITAPAAQPDVELPTLATVAREWISALHSVYLGDSTDQEQYILGDIETKILAHTDTTPAQAALKLCILSRITKTAYDDYTDDLWDETSQAVGAVCLPILRAAFGEDFDLGPVRNQPLHLSGCSA